MIKPTNDIKAINLVKTALQEAEMRQGCTDYTPYVMNLLKQLEDMGYHIGLPESTEWALNSGDGVYRP
jgi:hypothetical protein